ncbi:hypothetical protein CBR_g58496 [Chara braunii]|uniref:NADP-dependent oxidoreductase domain-containing protein n=1 Tax=Chara braunii TaxID=69332 RepID=A0A388MET1_CHABU|nr:hypothetical protein CBR_g58496 [Chara braunii]|eukprot:GBG93061.1 hypothetical protein CBR_g58496 [Chara braunii]
MTVGGDAKRFALNSGRFIPAIGLGTWKMTPEDAKSAVYKAVAHAGYRHVDCAWRYLNEQGVGQGLQAAFESGVVKREELFITSKVWMNFLAPEDVEACLRTSLRDLNLDYLDLYLIHWPLRAKRDESLGIDGQELVEFDMAATWRAMEDLVRKGLVKDIGVSNFSVKKLQKLLETAEIPPAVNQVETHPLWRNDKLLDFCKSQSIHVSAYSPLGSPDSIPILRANRPELHIDLMKDPTVVEVGKNIGKTAAQVLIRWGVQRGTSVLAKSVSLNRLKENIDVLDWELPQEDFERISTAYKHQARLLDGDIFIRETGLGPKSIDELWDGEL